MRSQDIRGPLIIASFSREHDYGFIKNNLEIAAAQLAIVLATQPDESPSLLEDRIPKPEALDLELKDILTDREREFLPAAHIVVGLIFDVAKMHAAKKQEEKRLAAHG